MTAVAGRPEYHDYKMSTGWKLVCYISYITVLVTQLAGQDASFSHDTVIFTAFLRSERVVS